MDRGRLSIETSLLDRERDRQPDSVEDTLLVGDTVLRYGIADHSELRFGWTPYGRSRERDRLTGELDRSSGVGDVTLGFKRNLIDPDGQHVSVALLPSISLPTGGRAIGDGDWGASMLVPVSVAIVEHVQLILTPEVDAAVNESGHGRHIAWGTAGGVQYDPGDVLHLTLEGQVLRDDDPSGHRTMALGNVAAGLSIGPDTQIDAGTSFALNRNAPDSRLYVGLSRRF